MNGKHNKALTPIARKLRKDMTREERHLWYDFLREYPIRFLRQKAATFPKTGTLGQIGGSGRRQMVQIA